MSTAKRLLSLLLCAVMIFSIFGCSSGNESSSDTSNGSGGNSGVRLPSNAPENYISLAEHETAYYRIVYAADLPGSVTKIINQNVETLRTKIGVVMECVSDKQLPAPVQGFPEILIGETNRTESIEASAILRSGEYVAKYDKTSQNVIIAGGSISAVGSAVNLFFSKNLDTAKRYLAIPNTYKTEKILNFPIHSVLINGVSIQEYSIVYPKGADLVTEYAALNLQDYLNNNMGVKLKMNDDSKAETKYEILVGKTKRTESNVSTSLKDGQYILMKKGDKIVMQGNGIYVGAAVGAFASKYLPISGTKKDVSIDNLATSPKAETYTFPSTFTSAIIMIGDGMGFNHIEMTKNSGMKDFYAEQFPNKGEAVTRSLTVIENKGDKWTDSAAAATALATGYKTYNGKVGVDKNNTKVQNIRELADSKGAKTAVITTDTINGATPGGFLAHNANRKINNTNNPEILNEINDLISTKKIEYTMGRERDDASAPNPDILEGAREALEIIATGGSSFFMMVEGAYIDKDSHNNRYDACVSAVKQFNEVIAYMSTFIFCHPSTALIVTADHETGNLVEDSSKEYGFRYSNNSEGNPSSSETAYRQHTNKNVPVFALGPKTEYFNGYAVENVCIPHFAAQAFGSSSFGDSAYTNNRNKLN